MANYGSDISRTLDAVNRQFSNILFRKGKPPLDAEYNLQDDICSEKLQNALQSMMPSGFVLDPTRTLEDYQFDPSWSNMFVLGNPAIQTLGQTTTIEYNPVVWANVNGWLVPVVGTDVDAAWIASKGETTNIIRLNPPPESDARIDFVFLEVWQARVDANPATANKPSAAKIWKYGNVQFGGTNLTDDLEDPTLGYQTSARVQVQYRIRVFGSGAGQGQSADLINYPDGLGYPNILGQGAANSTVAGYAFENMRDELGDPSLWRAGDGNTANGMGTIDGYTYAIPICAVFRRNSRTYVAVNSSGNPNHNGGFSRTPGTNLLPNPLTGAKVLTTAEVVGVGSHVGIYASDGFSPSGFAVPATSAEIQMPYGNSIEFDITVSNLIGSGLDDSAQNWPYTYIKIDDEIFSVTSVDTVAGTIKIPENGRGRFGTAITTHFQDAAIEFFNTRPDGLYSDQIAGCDILDLRHGINAHDWDFGRLLERGVTDLLTGRLKSAWKREAASYGGTQGTYIHEVDHLYAYDATHPNGTEPIDGPDGVRYVWSDAAAVQPNVTVLLDNEATTSGSTPQTVESFNATVEWDVAPGFRPSGFLNTDELAEPAAFTNGAVLLFHIGGEDGTGGARGTFRDGATRAVRFLMPKEMWRSGYPVVDTANGNQYPIQLRFWGEKAFEPPPASNTQDAEWAARAARHVGPMYPWKDLSFEYPFIALGGILNDGSLMRSEVQNTNFSAASDYMTDVFTDYTIVELDLLSYDFDTNGNFGFWTVDSIGSKQFTNDTDDVTKPLLRGERTLYGLLTDNGRDLTGLSSEVYLVIYGDDTWRHNNGAFQVIGAGTVGYTSNNAANGSSVVLRPLSADYAGLASVPVAKTLMVEFRSPYHNADDTSNADSRIADLAIVLTDLGGELDKSITVSDMTLSTGDHPWKAGYLGSGGAYDYDLSIQKDNSIAAVAKKALVDLTLVYHPGRGSMNRVPDELTRFALKGNNTQPQTGGYLRGNPANVDTTFSATSGVPSDEIWWDPAHVQLWNRLPSLGWSAPNAEDYGGAVVGYTEQDRENELFYDRGSKTAIFRPFRDRQMTLQAVSIREDTGGASAFPAGYGLQGLLVYPDTHSKDEGTIFTAEKYAAFPVPFEFMPRFGRQDIPYYTDINAGVGPFLSGINHLFVDNTSTSTSNIFNIIGGETELTSVKTLIFRTDTPLRYGQYDSAYSVENARGVYFARKTTDINPSSTLGASITAQLAAVNSSDFGKGLIGIQLPPYIGPARVLGVYEKGDYDSLGGHTFKNNRWQMEEESPPNLLRTDADRQTLFILQDGARDLTTENGDHTYIIPSNAIDFTRSLSYISGGSPSDTFDDYEYIVECTIFGFAKGFINENNYVLMRRQNGHGGTNVDNFPAAIEFDDIHMVIPCPAGDNHQLYAGYNRTPYQGDPYFSVNGSAADYTARYGQVSIGHQYDMRIPIQQYDANGNYVPQITNPKSFEILASMDFYTTMGTGKVGGDFYPGTPLDIGHTELSLNASYRMPVSNTSPAWRIDPRTYSEGQKTNPNRSGMTFICKDNDSWCVEDGTSYDFMRFRFELLDGTLVDLYGATADTEVILTGAAPTGFGISSEDIFRVDSGSDQTVLEGTLTDTISVVAGAYSDYNVTVTGAAVGDTAIVNVSGDLDRLITMSRVTAPNTVRVRVIDPGEVTDSFVSGPHTVTFDNPLVAGTTETIGTPITIPRPQPNGSGYALYVQDAGQSAPSDGLVFTCQYVEAGGNLTVTVYVHNTSTSDVTVGTRSIRIGLVALAATPISVVGAVFSAKVFHTTGKMSTTVSNLVDVINNHSDLYQNVKAITEQDDAFRVIAVPTGEEGNSIKVTAQMLDTSTAVSPYVITGEYSAQNMVYPVNAIPSNAHPQPFAASASTPLVGGLDLLLNAGDGVSQTGLTGMIERLPLGALLQDSDFLCENPLNDHASAVKTSPVGPHPIQTLMPMTQQGEEFERFNGAPGQLIALSDGYSCITSFSSWTTTDPTGTRKYRIYRGAGAPFILSGENPGGPVDWVSDTFPPSSQPVLKGGVLACRAMLVRNFPESFSTVLPSEGDEIQMLVVTYGHLGDGNSQVEGITLDGIISPAGYGEGYAAADRYRISGRPMFRGFTRQVPDPADVQLAVYPDGIREPE